MRVFNRSGERKSEAGISLIEVSMATVFFVGALLVSTKFQTSINTGMRDSTERLERRSTGADLLDRLDTVLRSSSANLSPFRILDAQSPALSDDIDNDGDGEVDELDEAFLFSPALENGASTDSIWFQRIAGIDDTTVPPTIQYDPPSYVQFAQDPADPRDERDNDGDGLVDEGTIVLRVQGGERAVAGNVLEFAITRYGQELQVDLTLARSEEGQNEPEILHLHRTIYVKNW